MQSVDNDLHLLTLLSVAVMTIFTVQPNITASI